MAAGAMSTQLGSGARETRRSGALRRGRASHCAGAAAPARAEKRAVKKKQALLLKSACSCEPLLRALVLNALLSQPAPASRRRGGPGK